VRRVTFISSYFKKIRGGRSPLAWRDEGKDKGKKEDWAETLTDIQTILTPIEGKGGLVLPIL